MDHIKILKRSFNITVNYRVLWIFGMLLALTAGGGGNGGGGGNSGTRVQPGNDGNWNFDGNHYPFGSFPQITPELTNTIIAILVGVACLLLALIILSIIVRYVSETAVIRMVDQHENDATQLTLRQGWSLGWSRAAWNMFLMDFLVGLSFLAALLVLGAIVATPLLFLLTKSVPLQVLGVIVTIGLGMLLVFAIILAAMATNLVVTLARRACALDNLGVIASLQRGFTILKGRFGDMLLMAIILFGVGLVWILVMLPVILAAALIGAIVAGLPALLIGGIAGLFTQGATPWIIAGVVAGPLFLITFIIPTSLVSGWRQIFSSSAWTLTYREAVAMENTKQNGELSAPAPEAA